MVLTKLCMRWRLAGVMVGSLLGIGVGWSAEIPPAARRPVDFVKDIQPIFQKHCLSCHGPQKQEAEFRLDAKSIALKGGALGPAIIPGRSAESLLIQAVSGVKEDLVMPRRGERLTAEQIGLLRAWIDQGAKWPESASVAIKDKKDHWSFQPVRKVSLPKVKNKKWPLNSVDHFVLSRLEKEGLKPSPAADRTTLIRRLSLDLTGLPPTPEEVDAFVQDKSKDAYEKVVDRLLASEHYGERWARHWLDLARYADTNGYEKDLPRSIWPYRDWVIQAFNQDLPYDQFTIYQLAGDHFPNPTLDQKVATGFLRNSMINEEGGVDPEQFRTEAIIDRVDAVGKAFLGLTIACAQCHNHKYDPISQKEYYQFFAFLNNDDDSMVEYPTPEQKTQRAEISTALLNLEKEIQGTDPEWESRQKAWEQKMKEQEPEWTVLEPAHFYGSVGTKFTKMKDHSLLATASSPPFSIYAISARSALSQVTAIRLEVLTDPNLPRGGPGRANNGNFVLSEFEVMVSPPGGATTNAVPLQHATADFSQKGFEAEKALDGNTKTGWGIDAGAARINQDRKMVFETKEPLTLGPENILTFYVKQLHGSEHTIGRLRLSVTSAPRPIQADPLPAAVRKILSIAPEQRTASQRQEVFRAFRATESRYAAANQKAEELLAKWPAASTTLTLTEREVPRETAIFKRGDFRKPGDKVSAGTPGVLHDLPKSNGPVNRMTLAQWMVDPRNPLTARVAVNRIWQTYFGQGLVITPEDFGTRCDEPSHPELLDYLAQQFVQSGWKVKDLHRLIVTSATYRQSSKVSPQLYQTDPYNRWLARAPRHRVEAEVVRDVALSISGLLSPKIGGPSVYPPIPDGVLSLGYGAPMPWPTSQGEARYRRAMYTFWKRSVPYPALLTFDAPTADVSCPRRVRSNTPLQALTTLNDPLFTEAAQALAARILRHHATESDSAKLQRAFRLCVGRAPTAPEEKELISLLEDHRKDFSTGGADPKLVITRDPKTPPVIPENVTAPEWASWTLVSRVLLNLDETLTRE